MLPLMWQYNQTAALHIYKRTLSSGEVHKCLDQGVHVRAGKSNKLICVNRGNDTPLWRFLASGRKTRSVIGKLDAPRSHSLIDGFNLLQIKGIYVAT